MKMKPATPMHVGNVKQAIECLRSARDLLKVANCPHTVKRIRLALTSAGGALRHVEHRERRTQAGTLNERYSYKAAR
jgi:hypothetical protein